MAVSPSSAAQIGRRTFNHSPLGSIDVTSKPADSSFRRGDVELTPALPGVLDVDVNRVRRQQAGDALGPLDDDHAGLLEEFRKPDGVEIVGAGDAVGVEVVDGEAAARVDVEQDERGAGD